MDFKREWKRVLEKAHMYGLLAEYYKYRDPDLFMHYYRKHYKYTKKVAGMTRQMRGRGTVAREGFHNPQRQDEEQRGTIRVIHASPDAPAVDVVANGQTIGQNLAFGQVSETLSLPAGSYQIGVYPRGQRGQPLYSEEVTLQPGRKYTIAAINRLDDLNLQVIEDEPRVREGMSKIRLVHLSVDAPPLDLATDGGDVLLFNLTYPNVSEYYVSPPAIQDLELRAAGSERVLLEIPNVSLRPDSAYSIYVLGLSEGEPPLQAVVLQD
ncbi:DUF4397 domain-containing protein [Melghirimyces algeriensis]|uniref:DUF4397 domain-containing protein n=1 Tax=Melghirimyces algeriensis TaxID=910412 RepID=A0A521BUZ0_9BACL|nr:DUF4397 domain-containing protein [Melghirimyces algeriensis]SMO50968.1 protein of unknown function [Melghirimyces algeriensis]